MLNQLFLDLRMVNYVAQIWINESFVGNRMWEPFQCDISPYVQEGQNTITVRVGNLLVNKMATYDGMNQLKTWGNWGRPADHLFSSGLFGPVQLISVTSPSD